MIRCLLGSGSIPHSMIKLSNVRRQCLHSFTALGALGSKSSRSGFMRRFMMTDLLSVDSAGV